MNDLLTTEQIENIEFNPVKNDTIITIMRDLDGNYRGFTQKYGKLIQVRTAEPNAALTLLMTHE
jgi:hypothetical protein